MSIKQKIRDHFRNYYTLSYGMANDITNSQSGYRRMQEIIKETPGLYRYVKVKSQHGGYYNVFAFSSVFSVKKISERLDGTKWAIVTSTGAYSHKGDVLGFFKTKKEAQSQIRKVVR